jgi:RNA 2',3'-cyclic 3'-phosphodiesterase
MQLEFGFSEAPQRSGFPAKGIGIRRMRRPVDSRPSLILPGLQYRAIVTLFFALQLEANAAAQAFAIPCQIGLNLPKRSIVPQENLHATLHLVAQQEGIPESLRQRAREAISGVSGSSFDVTFDRLENFNLDPPRHALVLLCGQGLESLTTLHRQIGEALRLAGFKHIGKSFVPHITLVYNTTPFQTPPVAPISWRVNRFALIESPQGKRKHLIQGSWILP